MGSWKSSRIVGLCSLVLGLVAPAWSLYGMHDVRYNLKPEVLIPEQSEYSGGFQTRWGADGDFIGAFKFGINNRFEVGSKFMLNTYNRFEENYAMLDLGVKVSVGGGGTVQSDVLLGLNNDAGGGAVFTYSQGASYTKRFSAIYETRFGFFDILTGGNWMMLESGVYPQFRVADPLSLRMGLSGATTLRRPVDMFLIDLHPGFVLGVTSHMQLFAECAVDVIGGNGIRLAAHLIGQF